MQLRRNTWVRKLREISVTEVKSGGTYREKSCAIHYAGWPFRRTWPANPWQAHSRSCVSELRPRMETDFARYVALSLGSLIKENTYVLSMENFSKKSIFFFFALEDISILGILLEPLFIERSDNIDM